MKRKITFNSLLHNDRLILVVSLVLAIVVWATVVYGPSNEQERTISGVPVTVSLNEYATDTLNMKLLDGHDIVASVKVYGRRSVVEQLTAQDILLTADTSAIVAPGTYQDLTIKATKNGKQTDFDIVSVQPSSVSLTCDIWTEASFEVQTRLPALTSADETKFQLGTPVVSGDALENGVVKVSGPKTEIDRIGTVVAVVDAKEALSETKVFDATLKALGKNGEEIDISHCVVGGDQSAVKVTVPILVYKKVTLQYQLLNTPAAYVDTQNLVTFTPAYLELWGTEQSIADFEAQLTTLTTFDFDNLTKETLKRELPLTVPDTLKILGSIDSITAKFNLNSISSKKLNVTLNDDNIEIINCPAGVTVKPAETTLNNIVIYGPYNVVSRIRATDLHVVVDVKSESTLGQRTCISRISVPKYDNVWVYYGENEKGYQLLTTVEKQ